jgi:hypothetical protein
LIGLRLDARRRHVEQDERDALDASSSLSVRTRQKIQSALSA